MLGDGVIFSRQVKQCLGEKVAFDKRSEGNEGGSSAGIQGHSREKKQARSQHLPSGSNREVRQPRFRGRNKKKM